MECHVMWWYFLPIILTEPTHGQTDSRIHIAVFEAKCQRYYISSIHNCVPQVRAVPLLPSNALLTALLTPQNISSTKTLDQIMEYSKTKNMKEQCRIRKCLRALYGPNVMSLPASSFCSILATVVFQPFYLFQYFSLFIWLITEYYIFCGVIFLITDASIYMSTSETLHNLRRLHGNSMCLILCVHYV